MSRTEGRRRLRRRPRGRVESTSSGRCSSAPGLEPHRFRDACGARCDAPARARSGKWTHTGEQHVERTAARRRFQGRTYIANRCYSCVRTYSNFVSTPGTLIRSNNEATPIPGVREHNGKKEPKDTFRKNTPESLSTLRKSMYKPQLQHGVDKC